MIGQTIAHYKVTAKLGSGGMGEVYRATDTKLGRDVALKVLPPAFAQDEQRMARFHREAQVLASLNHPNIAAIYGLEESTGEDAGVTALAMELVEGPTLAERIAAGSLPLDEALSLAKQIAEGLEYAHERGIIHRDLKPANVKLTTDGKVKVLDFGLAKALQGDTAQIDVANSPTLSMAATKAGIILGTAAYMSPEQAKGKAVDRRADIWSFGGVLFEMLTGHQLYSGETASETMAQVILQEPNLERLPGNTPPLVRQLLRRCLQREPSKRLQAIGEARIVLEDPQSSAAFESPAGALAAPASGAKAKRMATLAASWLVVAAVAGVLAWNLKPQPPEIPLRKFEFPVEQLNNRPEAVPKISPDETRVVYATASGLWIRGLNSLDSRKLTDIPAWLFAWSPDGESVAYIFQGKLWKVPASGGSAQVVSVVPLVLGRGSALDWGSDGKIVLAIAMPQTGLIEVSTQGGDPVPLLQPKEGAELDFHGIKALPDGRGFLYIIDRGRSIFDSIAVLANSQPRVIMQMKDDELNSPVYSPTGHIVFHRATTNPGIWAVPFSLARLETTGEPFLLAAQGLRPDVSADGTLTYIRGAATLPQQLVWLDRTGKTVETLSDPKADLFNHALSPDGRLASVNSQSDVWVLDIARKIWSRLTFTEKADEFNMGWLPDGKQVLYVAGDDSSGMRALWLKPADGSGSPQKLVEGTSGSFSADGSYLVYSVQDPKTGGDLWAMPMTGDRKPFPIVQTPASEGWPYVSPNGKYLLYQSNESGEPQIYVRPFPSGEGKWQVSAGRSFRGRWSRAGDKIHYMDRTGVFEVDVTLRPSFALGKPRPLFNHEAKRNLNNDFDPAPDGKRFLAVQDVEGTASTPTLVVVQNWFAEFGDKRKK